MAILPSQEALFADPNSSEYALDCRDKNIQEVRGLHKVRGLCRLWGGAGAWGFCFLCLAGMTTTVTQAPFGNAASGEAVSVFTLTSKGVSCNALFFVFFL